MAVTIDTPSCVTSDTPAPATTVSSGKGKGWHGDSAGHAAAGRAGGAKTSSDRDHMRKIGRLGGKKVSRDSNHMATIGRRGGLKVSQDRAHMAEIGKKGGESR